VKKDDETDNEYQARKAADEAKRNATKPNIIGCLTFNLFAVPVLCLWGICWISCCCPVKEAEGPEENPRFRRFQRIHMALMNFLVTGKLVLKSGPATSPETFETEASASPPTKEAKETPSTGQVCDTPPTHWASTST
jgi:hypothetical protein